MCRYLRRHPGVWRDAAQGVQPCSMLARKRRRHCSFRHNAQQRNGARVRQISRFTMKRLDSRSAFTAPAVGRTTADRARNDVMAAVLREAITAPEGLEAFDRIMSQPHLVQAVASSVDVNLWSRQLLTMHAGRLAGDEASEDFSGRISRPILLHRPRQWKKRLQRSGPNF